MDKKRLGRHLKFVVVNCGALPDDKLMSQDNARIHLAKNRFYSTFSKDDMSEFYPTLEEGGYYHIYNRANGSDNLFRQKSDYRHFLRLYQKYIVPVADTFAWVLMPNHFHLLVRIKERMVYEYSKEDFKNTIANATGPQPANANAGAGGLANKIISFDDVKWRTIPLNSSASERPDDIKGKWKQEQPDDIKREPDDIKRKEVKRKFANPTRHFGHLCNAYAKYVNEKYQRHGSLFQRPFRRKPVAHERYLRQLVLYIHNNSVHHGFVPHTEDYPWSSYHTYLSPETTELCKTETLDWFGGISNFIEMHQQYAADNEFRNWLEED